MARQIRFRIIDEDYEDGYGGILFDERWIICGCCGTVFDLLEDDIEILEEFDEWMPIYELE